MLFRIRLCNINNIVHILFSGSCLHEEWNSFQISWRANRQTWENCFRFIINTKIFNENDYFSFLAVNIHLKDVGPLEDSGFTHNKNIEPITYLPDDPHTNEKPVSVKKNVWQKFYAGAWTVKIFSLEKGCIWPMTFLGPHHLKFVKEIERN